MTANLRIETDRRENVVRIPNAALRWRPPSLVPEATPASAPEAAQPGRGGNGAMRITEFVEAIKTELNLNAAQTKEVDAAIADMRKSFAGSAGGEADPSARRERGGAARQELEDRVTALLDAGQLKFSEIKKRLSEQGSGRASQIGRVFVTGKDGKPQGTTVRIGATDGVMTEIVSGLDAGRDVIIGGGPKTTSNARAALRLLSHGSYRNSEAHAPVSSRRRNRACAAGCRPQG